VWAVGQQRATVSKTNPNLITRPTFDPSHPRDGSTRISGFKSPCFYHGQWVAYSTARVYQSTKPGLPGENCGHYELLNNATDAQKIDDDHLVQEPKEARAAYYAKQCYKEDSLITNPDLCAMSYNQSIAYTIEYPNDRPCPFSAPEICADPYAAIRFTTGLFPTSALGINSPHVPYARRNATCSPLSVNEPFVTRSASETDGRPQNLYWYGRIEDADWTFNTSGDPFDSVFPVYAVT
jgi:hypothetical protein